MLFVNLTAVNNCIVNLDNLCMYNMYVAMYSCMYIKQTSLIC